MAATILTASLLLAQRVFRKPITSALSSIGGVGSSHLEAENPRQNVTVNSTEKELPLRYKLTNFTSKPIRLIGFKGSCSCTKVGDLPMLIPPYGKIDFPVTITIPDSNHFFGSIELYTDDSRNPVIELAFTGQIDQNKVSRHAMSPDAVNKD